MEIYSIADFETMTREPVIRPMPDGSLLCTFLTGGPMEPHNSNVVAISRSFDRGQTWTVPKTIVSHSSRGCWATEIFVEGNEPYICMQTYNAKCHYREMLNYKVVTHDSGKTWDEPVTIKGMTGLSVRQGIRLSNGNTLFPVYWMEISGDFDWDTEEWFHTSPKWKFVGGVAVSNDGEHFERYGYGETQDHFWENQVIEVEPGHLIMYARNNSGYLARMESRDWGHTWGPCVLSDIPNSNTKFSIIKVGNRFVLLNNFSSPKEGRTHLGIAISDDGIHFGNSVYNIMPENEKWFYPHAFADTEERILYISFENMKNHKLAKIQFDELGL